MVTALTCGADERYNAFVTKYRPELTAQDRALGSYFTRARRPHRDASSRTTT